MTAGDDVGRAVRRGGADHHLRRRDPGDVRVRDHAGEPGGERRDEAVEEGRLPAGFDRRAFLACYGMAECTLGISFSPLTASRKIVLLVMVVPIVGAVHAILHQGAEIDRFLDAVWMERGLSPNTLAAYRRDLSLYAAWPGRIEPPARTRAFIELAKARLGARRRADGGRTGAARAAAR